MENTKNKPNNLINEKSPYLLQHAYNPVDWHAWGEDAFEKAKKEDKPIFLSIGYSTCHWCHVMEHESFEDEEVAKLLNDSFVCIKVDREERPDIDGIYMLVCQMMTGSGGWPLNVLLDTNRKPFFAGTYFPKKSNYGRVGMVDLIPRLNDVWKNKRVEIEESSNQIVEILKNKNNSSENEIDKNTLTAAHDRLLGNYDSVYGGFGSAPKFPSPQNILFLIRQYYTNKQEKTLEAIEKTLQEMAKGGIHDHVGYGFHRYSTDEMWLVPHFEKMLYDQAMLCLAYTEAYQLTKKDIYKDLAGKIISYVARDMTAAGGGFYSAEDADSEGVEGKFYVWSETELKDLLGDDFDFAKKIFNTSEEGNFLEESTRQKTGENILHLRTVPSDASRVDKIRQVLFDARKKRVHPYKDDKILTDWNGLMIAAMARAGAALKSNEYISYAEQAVNFVLKNLLEDECRLIHRYRDGESSLRANIDDYAFMIFGLLELYAATFDSKYLKYAIKFTDYAVTHFWDNENNGFYFTPDYGEELIVRKKEIYDGAIPSGNSLMLQNLNTLFHITNNLDYESKAQDLVKAFSEDVLRAPHGFTQFLCGVDFNLNASQEVVLVGEKDSDETKAMISCLNDSFNPRRIVSYVDSEMLDLIPHLKQYKPVNNSTTAYICSNFTCDEPIVDIDKFKIMISSKV